MNNKYKLEAVLEKGKKINARYILLKNNKTDELFEGKGSFAKRVKTEISVLLIPIIILLFDVILNYFQAKEMRLVLFIIFGLIIVFGIIILLYRYLLYLRKCQLKKIEKLEDAHESKIRIYEYLFGFILIIETNLVITILSHSLRVALR